MNERIRELEKLATPRSYDETGCYIGNRFDPEKFAELIVRECAKYLEENSGYDAANNAWHPEPEDLLKHFGVEE